MNVNQRGLSVRVNVIRGAVIIFHQNPFHPHPHILKNSEHMSVSFAPHLLLILGQNDVLALILVVLRQF